jgi:hypothetical protein
MYSIRYLELEEQRCEYRSWWILIVKIRYQETRRECVNNHKLLQFLLLLYFLRYGFIPFASSYNNVFNFKKLTSVLSITSKPTLMIPNNFVFHVDINLRVVCWIKFCMKLTTVDTDNSITLLAYTLLQY